MTQSERLVQCLRDVPKAYLRRKASDPCFLSLLNIEWTPLSRPSFCEVDSIAKWRGCLFLSSVQEADMAFSDEGWLLSKFELLAFLLSRSPPGILYDPNMVEEQGEQHKLLPERIQERAGARKKREETEENAKKRLLASHPYKLG